MKRALLAAWLALPLLAGTANAQATTGYVSRGGTVIYVASSCSVAELLAASRAWAKTPRVFVTSPAGVATAKQLRDYADEQEMWEDADERLRKAIEACGP